MIRSFGQNKASEYCMHFKPLLQVISLQIMLVKMTKAIECLNIKCNRNECAHCAKTQNQGLVRYDSIQKRTNFWILYLKMKCFMDKRLLIFLFLFAFVHLTKPLFHETRDKRWSYTYRCIPLNWIHRSCHTLTRF